MKKITILLFLSILVTKTFSQSVYVPINQDYSHLVERYEILSGKLGTSLHSHLKTLSRKEIAILADSLAKDSVSKFSKSDRFNIAYLQNDNWEWSNSNDSLPATLKYFYTKRSDFYQYQTKGADKDFDVHVNPVIYGSVGKDSQQGSYTYLNTRGVEIRGMISRKVGFYTYLTDNQARFPKYVQRQIKLFDALPGEGYYKDGDAAEPEKVDFISARGYFTFNATKNIALQFGHDKNFIGNGYRSMILSDYSAPYLFLKINTNVGKVNYQNIFAQMTAQVLNADGLRPQKYFAFHHLSMNITKKFNIGVWEAVVFGNRDSTTNNSFDLNYLNPIIFYRSAEQQLGSPDNTMVGMDFKWNVRKGILLYGQLVLDEFVIKEAFGRKGWWGNKQGGQLGIKYINAFGINNLDVQAEFNTARPYTYSHENYFKSYSNYQQPLAHPLGANFREFIGIVRYQPFSKVSFTGKCFYSEFGADSNNLNWGGNILLDYRTRVQDYGNKIGQGEKTKMVYLDFTATYQLWHNVFVDAKQVLRTMQNNLDIPYKNTSFSSLSIRWNMWQRLNEF
jgi:hypothetical protein